MAIVNTLKIYEDLRTKLQDEPAKAIAETIERSLEEYRENQKEFLVTKTEFRETIANLRAELIKWMFIFWIGQFASIVGVLSVILFAFFRK